MVVAIEEEAEIALPTAFAVPAIFLNRKLGSESVCRVVIKSVVERRIEKPLVVAEMVEVGHRQNSRAARAKDFQKQPVYVLEFGFKLVKQRVVIIAPGGDGLKRGRHVLQRARDVEDHSLPTEFAF